jgi:hypothetical protein
MPEETSMPYSVQGYKERADQCVKLANLADDELVRRELLNLRQTYLKIADRLKRQGFESAADQGNSAIPTHETLRGDT